MLVSDIPAGDGKSLTFFYSVRTLHNTVTPGTNCSTLPRPLQTVIASVIESVWWWRLIQVRYQLLFNLPAGQESL
jgi:hypothetical protein